MDNANANNDATSDANVSDDRPLFQGIDEFEREFAPDQLPPDDPARVRAEMDDGGVLERGWEQNEIPSPAPVSSVGSSPSSAAAPPNIGHEDHGGAPGDPETQAADPLDPNAKRTSAGD